MKLFTRLFARYAAHVGYLDGKRNFPGEHDFVELTVHRQPAQGKKPRHHDAEILKIDEASPLNDRKQ